MAKFDILKIAYDKEKIKKELQENFSLKGQLSESEFYARIVSLGEKLSGIFYADFLEAEFLDPADIFVLKTKRENYSNGFLDFEATKEKISQKKDLLEKIKNGKKFVVPGFYGADEDGKIVTFSRGGSDLTGAYIAYFFKEDLYENFTDFPILSSDPRTVDSPRKINKLTFSELRDLTYAGFSILHKDVVLPLAKNKIKIEIKSTENFKEKGTLIAENRDVKEEVLAVASLDNLALLNISKIGLDNIDFITADILQILKQNHIPLEHISTGIDDISLFIENKKDFNLDKVIEEIEHELKDDTETKITIDRKVALACLSGNGMKGSIGVFAKAATILAKNEINIISTSQPASERNIIFFVKSSDIRRTVRALYDGFIK